MDYDKIFSELRESMATLALHQIKEAQMLSEHGDKIAKLEQEAAKHREEADRYRAQTEKNLARVSQTLAEVGDKLNGLIGYVDRLRPNEPPS